RTRTTSARPSSVASTSSSREKSVSLDSGSAGAGSGAGSGPAGSSEQPASASARAAVLNSVRIVVMTRLPGCVLHVPYCSKNLHHRLQGMAYMPLRGDLNLRQSTTQERIGRQLVRDRRRERRFAA